MDPTTVRSPKAHWTLIDVLYDGGNDEHSLAIGEWDGTRVLAARWNGASAKEIGNPQSRGLPTWFVLPEVYWAALLDQSFVPREKVTLAKALLGLKDRARATG
jgi:hypothetical protein